MTAVGDPPEESIALLCDIIAVSRDEAIKRLRANNNSLQNATEEYFEDPSGAKYKWDESAFAADHQGETGKPAFNIQGPDETGQTSYYDHGSAAPTRPPSRANNRSPLGAPTTSAQEDEDLQRALAQSAAESGIPHQESGVVDSGTSAPYFGPANRPQYDSEQWAMVPTKVETEVVTELAPSARKRDPEAPAFLTTTKEHRDHRLGALVSILHKIPTARNILLSVPPPPSQGYGFNSQWWNGQSILKPEQLSSMANDTWGNANVGPEFSDEIHRLIAFLDNTDRSYGNADPLSDAEGISGPQNWFPEYEKMFYEVLQLKSINNPEFDISPMMTEGKVNPIAQKFTPEGQHKDADLSGEVVGEDQENNVGCFALIDLELSMEAYTWVNSLYGALDELFWPHALAPDSTFPDGDASAAFITKPGDILTIRFGGSGLCKPCDIPAVFYADRYLHSRKDLAVFFQSQIYQLRKLIRDTQKLKRAVVKCNGEADCYKNVWLPDPHGTRDCCRKIIKRCVFLMERQRKRAQWRYWTDRIDNDMELSMRDLCNIHNSTGPYEFNDEEKQKQTMYEESIEAAKRKIEAVNQALEDCDAQIQDCYRCLDVVSKRLTKTEDEANEEFDQLYITRSQPEFYRPEYWNPTHKYLLRGVSTTKEVTYICTRRDEDLIELEAEPRPRDQWWRVAYAVNDRVPLKVEKTDLDTVLVAAGTESKNPILVYATEKAMKAPPLDLSDALRRFVRADNRAFQQELAQEQTAKEQVEMDQVRATPVAEIVEEPVPLTFDAMKTFAGSKGNHSSGSSVATLGSSTGDVRDMDMDFSDQVGFFGNDNSVPRAIHQEFASPSPKSSKLSGIVESLANCRAHESESPVLGRRELNGPESADALMEELQTFNPNGTVAKAPEMKERPGSVFLTKPNTLATQTETSVDFMDMDLDSAEH